MSAQYNDTAPATAPQNLVLAITSACGWRACSSPIIMICASSSCVRPPPGSAAANCGTGRPFVAGLEHGVDAFLGMLRGENTGKMVVSLDVGAR